ncbi:MAG: hypothetical protein JRG71_16800 [Deltaproteobacteria bacterium]|nr:hypothetical protein [Deltaproteobacteria bacterium]
MLGRFTLYGGSPAVRMTPPPAAAPVRQPRLASAPANDGWGGGQASSGNDFIALDDDEFGKF